MHRHVPARYGYLDIYVNRTALGDQSGDSSRALRMLVVADMADGSSVMLASGTGKGRCMRALASTLRNRAQREHSMIGLTWLKHVPYTDMLA